MILENAGYSLRILIPDIDERDLGDPVDCAVENARRKLEAVAGAREDTETVVACDTIVVTPGGAILGKPEDHNDAARMIEHLAGKTHTVVSGLAVLPRDAGTDDVILDHESTAVTFRTLSAVEVHEYVATGEWRGRAGGYAIQESGEGALVEALDGDKNNVIGFPLDLFARHLDG